MFLRGRYANLEVLKLSEDYIDEALSLILSSFDKDVASTFTREGVRNFKTGIVRNKVLDRLSLGNVFLICIKNSEILGVAELRDNNHLNLLFTKPGFQKNGVGRLLFTELCTYVTGTELTVNSSLNSINAYKAMGFVESGTENEVQGIKYLPMVYNKYEKT